MTREEAIKKIREAMPTLWRETKNAIQTLVPELAESEDERIIKTLQECVKNRNWPLNGPTQEEVLAYLEKQKEQNHDGKKWLTPEELHRIEQLRYEAGFDAGVRSERAEAQPL